MGGLLNCGEVYPDSRDVRSILDETAEGMGQKGMKCQLQAPVYLLLVNFLSNFHLPVLLYGSFTRTSGRETVGEILTSNSPSLQQLDRL